MEIFLWRREQLISATMGFNESFIKDLIRWDIFLVDGERFPRGISEEGMRPRNWRAKAGMTPDSLCLKSSKGLIGWLTREPSIQISSVALYLEKIRTEVSDPWTHFCGEWRSEMALSGAWRCRSILRQQRVLKSVMHCPLWSTKLIDYVEKYLIIIVPTSCFLFVFLRLLSPHGESFINS